MKDANLAVIVEQLARASRPVTRQGGHLLPSQAAIIRVMEQLRAVLFPGYFGSSNLSSESLGYHLGSALHDIRIGLEEQILRALAMSCTDDRRELEAAAHEITASFLHLLPEIERTLATDVHAAYQGDPSARSPDEVILSFPGMRAITNFRIAHALDRLGAPFVPRVLTEHAHSTTGIDIHPGATIGDSFFMDHGTGVVIGETCEIGNRVTLYQGVTLGAKSFQKAEDGSLVRGLLRHPVVEDDVVIYAGATILGRVTIGTGAVIGGNVWVTRSVPAGGRVTADPPRRDSFSGGAGI